MLFICLLLYGCSGFATKNQETAKTPVNNLSTECSTFRIESSDKPPEESIDPDSNIYGDYSSTCYIWDIRNPIDAYFGEIFQLPLDEASLGDYAEYYGIAWKTEYENLVSWTKDQMTFPEDINNLTVFEQNVEKSIELALEIIEVSDFSISPDNQDESRIKPKMVFEVGLTRVRVYRSAFCLLYGLFPNYEFLVQEYIPPEYLPLEIHQRGS